MFKIAGFELIDIDNFKPGAAIHKKFSKATASRVPIDKVVETSDKREYDLGFPGVALSSFLLFSHQYYESHRDDTAQPDKLNRHAILHGSADNFGTELNAVKLFTYLYLMLELEQVLKIIFNEE